MDSVLARVFTMPFDLPIKVRDGEGVGQLQTAISFDPCDNVLGRGIHVWAATMARELKFFSMRRDRRHDGLRRLLACRQCGRRENATDDDAGIHMPWLRLQTDFDGDPVFSG